MWKYIGVKECNDFLLSLNLFNCKDKKNILNLFILLVIILIIIIKYIKLKRRMVNIELYMNLIIF